MSGFDDYLKSSLAVIEATRRALDPERVDAAVAAITTALMQGKALLICGNGGSAADAMHIAAELVGRFRETRRALKAIALGANAAALTAWSNDYDFPSAFAREVEAYGEAGGVLLAISTSGTSANVLAAAAAARAKGMVTIGLTGETGGRLAPLVDILLAAPAQATPLVQQAHLCIYHYLCAEVEARISASARPSA